MCDELESHFVDALDLRPSVTGARTLWRLKVQSELRNDRSRAAFVAALDLRPNVTRVKAKGQLEMHMGEINALCGGQHTPARAQRQSVNDSDLKCTVANT